MTREELTAMREYQIGRASSEFYYANPSADAITAFEAGVLWADEHPLSEEDKERVLEPIAVDIPQEFEDLTLEEQERVRIHKALEKNAGNRKCAAADLGISERTLYRKMKEYDL